MNQVVNETDPTEALQALDAGMSETRRLRFQLRLAEWDAKESREAYETAKNACLANLSLIETLNEEKATSKFEADLYKQTLVLTGIGFLASVAVAIAGWLR